MLMENYLDRIKIDVIRGAINAVAVYAITHELAVIADFENPLTTTSP